MPPPRKVTDDERKALEEIRAIEAQLNEWKIPRTSATAPLTTLGRVRLLRNQVLMIATEQRYEIARLKRLVEEHEERGASWPFASERM